MVKPKSPDAVHASGPVPSTTKAAPTKTSSKHWTKKPAAKGGMS